MDNNFLNNEPNKVANNTPDAQSKETLASAAEEGKLDDSNLSDDFVIGQDFFIDSTEADNIFAEEQKNDSKKKRKKKSKKSCLTSAVWLFAIFFVSITAAVVLLYFGTDYLGVDFSGDTSGEININIEHGTSTKEIAEILEENDIIKSALFFRLYSKTNGYDSRYQYGLYQFYKHSNYEDIAEALIKKGALADEVTVTIKEGLNIDEIAKELEKNGVCTASQFKMAVNEANKTKYNYEFMTGIATPTQGVHYTLEGYLFPDTYRLYALNNKDGAEQAIRKMLDNMNTKLIENGLYKRAEEFGITIHEAIIMASVIELEAGGAEYADMQNVSSVFWNRLNNWQGEQRKLQSDPTMKYPYNTESYDTYKIAGLAPGAYCSPSIESLKAALYPTENSKYYFFVTDKNEKFYFNETNSAHNKTIKQLKNQGLWLQ